MGSIPTRSRHLAALAWAASLTGLDFRPRAFTMGSRTRDIRSRIESPDRRLRGLTVVLLLLAAPPIHAVAQKPPVRPDSSVAKPARPDSAAKPGISLPPVFDKGPKAPGIPGDLRPFPAFFMSLAVPGLAQAKLDRKLTTGLFVAVEGLSIGMMLKASQELKYLRAVHADSAKTLDKAQEKQDWLVLLAFNHLFSGLEAFVSSHLQDFPEDVKLSAAPRGYGFQVKVPFRIR
ncbi:MAG: hypothetical protein ABI647_08185 [Gemmatimonadota bacterium]